MKRLLEMQHNSDAMPWVNGLNLCPCGSFPVPFCSLSVLMMDSCRGCMCDTHTHTHTHTHRGICHLFVSTFIYFLWFFYTLQFVWEKWGDAHTVCLSSVCALGAGGGCFLWEKKQSYEGSFSVLWTTYSPSPYSSMDIMYTTSLRKIPSGQKVAVLCFYICTVFHLSMWISNIIYVNSILFCRQCKWVADGLSSI